MKVAVLGAGTMGTGIAQVVAQSGFDVFLVDIAEKNLEKGYARIEKGLDKLISKEKITEERKIEILSRVFPTNDYSLIKDVDLVIEAIIEKMELKREIFSLIDKVVKDEAILATNTSSLSITEIASITKRPDKVIGLHFFNPAQIMKLVEVIKGLTTSDETTEIILEFVKKIGKEPVEVKEAPGFVVNRLLIPMINEAISIYADGVASAEDIDKAMMLGANHPMGPLALADLIGNDVNLAIMECLYKEFGDSKYRPHPTLRKMVRGNLLGRKTGEGFYNYKK